MEYTLDDNGYFYVQNKIRKRNVKEGDKTIGRKSFVSPTLFKKPKPKRKTEKKREFYPKKKKQEYLEIAFKEDIFTTIKFCKRFSLNYATVKSWRFNGKTVKELLKENIKMRCYELYSLYHNKTKIAKILNISLRRVRYFLNEVKYGK